MEYKLTPLEVPAGEGKRKALEFHQEIQLLMDEMARQGWRLVSTESEVSFNRSTWLRLFWERPAAPSR